MYRQNLRVFNVVYSNQEILTDFFESIIRIVSEGTSDSYAKLVLIDFNKRNRKDFPFVKYIHNDSKKIKVNEKINSVDSKLVSRFLNRLINSLFSELFKHLLKSKMNVKVCEELKEIGVKI